MNTYIYVYIYIHICIYACTYVHLPTSIPYLPRPRPTVTSPVGSPGSPGSPRAAREAVRKFQVKLMQAGG